MIIPLNPFNAFMVIGKTEEDGIIELLMGLLHGFHIVAFVAYAQRIYEGL